MESGLAHPGTPSSVCTCCAPAHGACLATFPGKPGAWGEGCWTAGQSPASSLKPRPHFPALQLGLSPALPAAPPPEFYSEAPVGSSYLPVGLGVPAPLPTPASRPKLPLTVPLAPHPRGLVAPVSPGPVLQKNGISSWPGHSCFRCLRSSALPLGMAGRVSRLAARGPPHPTPLCCPQDRMTDSMKECLAQSEVAVGDMVKVVKTEVCSPLRDQEYGQPW